MERPSPSSRIKRGDASAKLVIATMEKAHLWGRVEKTMISAPSADAMFVIDMNYKKYDNSLKTVNNAACPTKCLDPWPRSSTSMLILLNDLCP